MLATIDDGPRVAVLAARGLLAGASPDPPPHAAPRVSVAVEVRARIIAAERIDFTARSIPPPVHNAVPAPRRQRRADGRIEIAFE